MFSPRRAGLQARREEEARALSARQRAATTCGVKSIRCRIRKMEGQRGELDRLLNALDALVAEDPAEPLLRAVSG